VNFEQLNDNPEVLAEFEHGVAAAIAAVAGVTPDKVSLVLSPGSVVVSAMVRPGDAIALAVVQSRLKNEAEAGTLSDAVVNAVRATPGISKTTDGPISVSGVSVSTPSPSQPLQSQPPPPAPTYQQQPMAVPQAPLQGYPPNYQQPPPQTLAPAQPIGPTSEPPNPEAMMSAGSDGANHVEEMLSSEASLQQRQAAQKIAAAAAHQKYMIIQQSGTQVEKAAADQALFGKLKKGEYVLEHHKKFELIKSDMRHKNSTMQKEIVENTKEAGQRALTGALNVGIRDSLNSATAGIQGMHEAEVQSEQSAKIITMAARQTSANWNKAIAVRETGKMFAVKAMEQAQKANNEAKETQVQVRTGLATSEVSTQAADASRRTSADAYQATMKAYNLTQSVWYQVNATTNGISSQEHIVEEVLEAAKHSEEEAEKALLLSKSIEVGAPKNLRVTLTPDASEDAG